MSFVANRFKENTAEKNGEPTSVTVTWNASVKTVPQPPACTSAPCRCPLTGQKARTHEGNMARDSSQCETPQCDLSSTQRLRSQNMGFMRSLLPNHLNPAQEDSHHQEIKVCNFHRQCLAEALLCGDHIICWPWKSKRVSSCRFPETDTIWWISPPNSRFPNQAYSEIPLPALAFSEVLPGTRWALCLPGCLFLLKQTRAAGLSLQSQGMGPAFLSFGFQSISVR